MRTDEALQGIEGKRLTYRRVSGTAHAQAEGKADDPETPSEEANVSMEASMAKKRDTYKYQLKVGNKIVYGGITNDLERREAEHKEKWPKEHIKQVGRKTTEDGARKWEKDKGYT